MVHQIDNLNLQYYRSGLVGVGASYSRPISNTTRYYVSEKSSFGCEGPRTEIVAHVTQPDPISVSASNTTACPYTSVQLNASNTLTNNNYNYTWSASPALGSGLSNGTTGSSISIVPTTAGSYVYTATATDDAAGCVTLNAVTVTVNERPVMDSVRASITSMCGGTPSILRAYSGAIANGPQSLPTGYLPSNATSASDEDILNVTFASINNTSTCSTTGAGSSTARWRRRIAPSGRSQKPRLPAGCPNYRSSHKC